MSVTPLLTWLQETGLATGIRDSLFLFPLLEAVHVFGLALVFGTIVIIDLRLLGFASTHRSFQRMASDSMKWTWGAFAVTATTGVLMFITNATGYFDNVYFRVKIGLLVLAALNVGVFELTARRTINEWDRAVSAPRAGKTAAVMSLVLWLAIIVTGRMIGFTATRATVSEPLPATLDLDDLLGFPAETEPAPATPPEK